MTGKVTTIIISLIYVLSICATLPFTFMIRIVKYGNFTSYDIIYNLYSKSTSILNMMVYWNTIFFVTTLLPTIILTAIYYSASLALSRSSTKLRCSIQEKKRIVRNKKVNKMFAIAVVCFFLSVTPYTIFTALYSILLKYEYFFLYSNRNFIHWLDLGLQTIMTFNSCINPFVYCKTHKDIVYFFSRRSAKRNSSSLLGNYKSYATEVP